MNVDEDNLKTLSSSSSISSSKIQLIKDIGQTLTKNIRSKISFDSEHAVKNPDLLLKIVNENLHHQKYNNLHQAEEHKRLDFLGNNANNDAGITYESLHTSWVDDFVLPIFILTITICGTIIIGIILLFWLKNNISSNKHSAIQSYNKKTMQKSKHPPNETQHILNPTNNEKITHQVIKTNKIINDNRRSPVNEDLNVELKIKNSPPTSPTVPESTPRETNSIPSENIDCPESSTSTSTSKQKLGKNRVASLDDQTIRGHHIKHKKHLSRGHKVSLNDLSLNSYISPITTPSPTLKTHARKFSFSNNQFVQQSNTKNKYGALTGGSSNDNLNQKDNKHDWLLSSVSVDVCCIQPQQQVTESAYNFQFNNAEDIIGYDERTFILSPKIQSIEIRATISDDKENTIPSPISSSNINNNCVHSANRNLTTISTSKINESSSPLKSIESPKLHAMNVNILQNSPNWHDSSSSPTLIPITPSSVSSSSSTITNTTPNAAMGYTRHSRFTFSPKIISEYNTQQITSSPLVSSAGYKYGNYFKFPEVDVFTPPTATANNIPMLNKQTSIDIDDNENITTSPNPLINVNNNNNPILSCNMEQKPTYTVTDTDSESNKIDSKHNLLIDCNAETGEQCRNEGRKASITNDILNKEKEQHKLSLVSRVVRRARLKSISLDSEGARLVEENLCIPVEELVERANSTHHQQDTNQKQTSVFNFSAEDIHSASTENKNDDMFISKRKKNIFNLTLNLSDKDDTLLLDDDYKFNEFYFEYYDYDDDEEEYENTSQSDIYNFRKRRQQSQMQTPKTPTFSQTRHKASSLDSDQSLCYTKTHSNNNLVQHFDDRSNEEYPEQKTLTKSLKASSISVPTTPKRHQQQYLKAKSTKCNRLGNSATTISLIPIERSHVHTFHNKLKSFEENTDDQSPTSHLPNDDSQNSSNANLRTLPELTTANVENCEKPASTIMNKSRSSILQRRGSNHSLTLNLDTSGAGLGCNTSLSRGLSSSNYSLGNYKGSHLSLAGSSYNLPMQQQQIQLPTQKNQLKKNLLQRRGSNASLTLNLQGSVCNLNRFNSHNSLNIQNQQQSRPLTNKKGLLERRNSNASLTLNIQNKALSVSNCNLRGSNCSLNSMMTNQTANYEDSDNHLTVNNQRNYRNRPACKMSLHQPNSNMTCSQQHNQRRKFLSSESLHNISNAGHTGCCHNVPEHYGQLQQNQKNEYGSIDNMQCNESLNNMSGAGAMFAMKSTVTSTSSANNLANFTKCDCCSDCCCNYEDSLASGTGAMNIGSTNVRNITTKPLSPQTTSEDFKIYLANIQFLQNASNILTSKQLKNLNYIFNKSYNNNSQNNALSDYHGSNNDVQLMNIRTDLTKTTEAYRNNFDQKENDLPSEDDQKKMLIKIHQEFWDLPTNYQEKPLVFGSQSKNRYKTILPNEHSRVVLQAETGTITEPYINANFIKGPDYASNSYIATQGPMQNTIYEFWVMIFQNIMKIAASQNMENLHNIDQKLIMLTDFIENTRQKCSVYFPQQIDDVTVFTNSTEHTQLIYDNANNIYNNVPNDILNIKCNYFLVKNVGICQKNGYSKRKLHVIHFCQEATTDTFKSFSFMVYHYWFPDWPDHRSPEDINVLLDMSLDILDNDCSLDFLPTTYETECPPKKDNQLSALPIIHCSAGIGRTGCLLAILNGLSQMRLHSIPKDNQDGDELGRQNDVPEDAVKQSCRTINTERQVTVDILGIVCNLRLQRGGMVQNSEQYELIHRALCLYEQKYNKI